MRLDHIAYRVADRNTAAEFFVSAFGYRVADEFRIKFDDGSSAKCFALNPPEACERSLEEAPWFRRHWFGGPTIDSHIMHLPPQIFVSDGSPGSIVEQWVAERRGIGGVHHLAYEVEDVAAKMEEWRKAKLAEFTTEEPISNGGGLVQCFTKPHPITGVIYEFIHRGKDNKGFNVDSVRDLMESTT